MNAIIKKYHNLNQKDQKKVQIFLCEKAYLQWLHYISENNINSYIESVCGTPQTIDRTLPLDAINAVKENNQESNIYTRYSEPMVALQDNDLVFPQNISFAYYAIYNLFELYIGGKTIDSWIIMNQAFSSFQDNDIENYLENAIEYINL